MVDIEEHAERWARERAAKFSFFTEDFVRELIGAYLAGSTQTQADYSADDCRRCVCTCGAR